MNTKQLTLLLLAVAVAQFAYAQVSAGGTPVSFSSGFIQQYDQGNRSFETIPKLDLAQLQKEDTEFPSNRFAAPVSVDFDLYADGEWFELSDGSRVWQLAIAAPQALGLAVFYDDFYLPPGSSLFMFTPDRKMVLGAFTAQNNRPTESFWTGIATGSQVIIEYFEPATSSGLGRLHIDRIDQVYNADNLENAQGEVAMERGFGTALECHVNVNCPEGDPWQDEKRGVCRVIVIVEEGMGYCSASLINNTANDGTPYVLGAFHCQDGYTPLYDMWRFDFNYEATGCNNPAEEPGFQSLLGAELRASRQQSDFLLLEITEAIPFDYNLYFNGWDRSAPAPDTAVLIHQPSGDIKKIAFDYQGGNIFNGSIEWDNGVTTPQQHHFEFFLDHGTFEAGASGCPVFNEDKRIIAQLHGGTSQCSQPQTFCGRLSMSWTGGGSAATRLSDWLDPLGSGTMTTNGVYFPADVSGLFGGQVQLAGGTGVPGVAVGIFGDDAQGIITSEDGSFSLTGITTGSNFTIECSKTDEASNGVSVIDLIAVQRHILTVQQLNDPYAVIAADVDGSGNVSVADLIFIRRVILGLEDSFPGPAIWQFVPANIDFPNPNDPFDVLIPLLFDINDFPGNISDFDLIGIKTGDVNGDVIL